MRDVGHILGQTQSLSSLFYAALGIACAAAVLSLIWLLMHRRMRRRDHWPSAQDFTLVELEKLHRQGYLNDSEFRTARSRIIEEAN